MIIISKTIRWAVIVIFNRVGRRECKKEKISKNCGNRKFNCIEANYFVGDKTMLVSDRSEECIDLTNVFYFFAVAVKAAGPYSSQSAVSKKPILTTSSLRLSFTYANIVYAVFKPWCRCRKFHCKKFIIQTSSLNCCIY